MRYHIFVIGHHAWILIILFGKLAGKIGNDYIALDVIAMYSLLVWTNFIHLPSGKMNKIGQKRLGTARSPKWKKNFQIWLKFCLKIILEKMIWKQQTDWKDLNEYRSMRNNVRKRRNNWLLNNSYLNDLLLCIYLQY